MSDARDTTSPTEPLPSGSTDATATTPLLPPAPDAATEAGAPGREASGGFASTAPAPAPAPAPRPTVRWGALVWALIFATVAAVTLWIIVDPERRDAADAWLTDLDPFAAGLYALIAVGVVVALFGIVGLIRRGERARA
jgi:hypothetical protein